MIQRAVLVLVLAVLVTACHFIRTPTSPSDDPKPASNTVSLTGKVTAAGGSGAGVKSALVQILDGPNAGFMMTTDSNGVYKFDTLHAGNANVSASANEFPEAVAGVHIDHATTLNFELEPPPWTARGTGSDVFDSPAWITRVRITAERGAGQCETLSVRVAGRAVMSTTLGTCAAGIPRYQGVHLMAGGGWVEVIAPSTAVSWTFEWLR